MDYPIGTVTYGAGAAAFFVLSVMLFSGWRGRLQGMLLALAAAGTCTWSVVLAYVAHEAAPSPVLSGVAEALHSAPWFAFLFVALGYSNRDVSPLRHAALALAATIAVLVGVAFMRGGIYEPRPLAIAFLLHLALAVAGLVLIEQLVRNVDPQQLWGIKFLGFAAGAMFAFDLYFYSQAFLFRRLDYDLWAARGAVNAFVVPLLAIAVARNAGWSLDISVSRRIVFHSTAMLCASVYLVAMAGAGYYLRYFGGTWGGVLQILCLSGAALLLLALFFSGAMRARWKVLVTKHFFSYRYDYREEWLRFTRTLSAGPDAMPLRERSIQAIAELVESPGGVLWLATGSGSFEAVAQWNMRRPAVIEQGDSAFCRLLREREWIVDLSERRGGPPADMPQWLQAIEDAWLVVPLLLHDRLSGYIVLLRSKGGVRLDWEVRDLLKTAARQAASYIGEVEAARALLVARQFDSFNRMSAFVVHDLKNLVAQLSLLVANAERHKHTPAFQDDVVETLSFSVDKMKRLLTQLAGAQPGEPPTAFALYPVLQEAVSAARHLRPMPRLMPGNARLTVFAHAARLQRVVGHLVQNAVEATAPEGSVTVSLRSSADLAVIEVTDTGRGMSEEFIATRLFNPFQSTKSGGMGIGAYETREYMRELGGRVEVQSVPGRGTSFRLLMPAQDRAGSARTVQIAGIST